MTKAVAFGLAGLPRAGQRAGALLFWDALERVIGRQVAGVGRVYSSDERMLGGLYGEAGPGVEGNVENCFTVGGLGKFVESRG
jgi:hypothetical protein